MTDAIEQAVLAAGGQSKLAELLGLQRQQIHSWLVGVERIPVKHLKAIEAATGVKRAALRPDIYA